jgi:histidine triad (HIT) family protein
MASIFSKIAAGEIPCYKVAETQDLLAFLDINPLAKGHTLVIPKKEIDYFFDLDAELYVSVLLFAKEVAKAIQTVTQCKRVGIAVVGFEVPHAHIHLVPMNDISDLNFSNPRISQLPEELEKVAMDIRAHL